MLSPMQKGGCLAMVVLFAAMAAGVAVGIDTEVGGSLFIFSMIAMIVVGIASV